MATITQKLGDRIRQLRKKQGLSQEQVAAKAKIDLTTLNEIENGNRNPSIRTVYKISLALNVNLSNLLNI